MNGNVYSRARNALMKAGQNAYIGRKAKKRNFRRLWNVRINNAVRPMGMNYSGFIHALYIKRVGLERYFRISRFRILKYLQRLLLS